MRVISVDTSNLSAVASTIGGPRPQQSVDRDSSSEQSEGRAAASSPAEAREGADVGRARALQSVTAGSGTREVSDPLRTPVDARSLAAQLAEQLGQGAAQALAGQTSPSPEQVSALLRLP